VYTLIVTVDVETLAVCVTFVVVLVGTAGTNDPAVFDQVIKNPGDVQLTTNEEFPLVLQILTVSLFTKIGSPGFHIPVRVFVTIVWSLVTENVSVSCPNNVFVTNNRHTLAKIIIVFILNKD
jgi:hypothetical protein